MTNDIPKPGPAVFKAPEPSKTDADAQGDVQAENQAAPETPVEDDFIFVQMPDGKVRAVRKADVQAINAIDNADGTQNEPEGEFYLWLADGSTERVKESKIPGFAGTNAPHGHFERDGKSYQIVGVYPVETDLKKG
jgi:hypothetical protein